MASRLFFNPGALRLPLLATTVGASTCLLLPTLAQQYHHRNLLRLDSSPSSVSPKDWSFSSYQNDASAPVVNRNGGLNSRAVRQFSSGSIFGLLAGLGVSMFSKSLAFLIGVLVIGVQTAESYGIHLVPYNRIQRYVKGVNIRTAMQDNVAFKLSFGLMFAFSAFAQL
ncbi:Hypothetical protein R9X50_00375300 [Acrodontium crateriforme]|uniref:FUN14 family protein n=1 Tax=Acrodontium crateriforme TaxID=150365 RepID=A0AAQ3M3I5_9PEZI|nr:Hypothetical protein R9X50_00375300 [Acrodontium crateriforme]